MRIFLEANLCIRDLKIFLKERENRTNGNQSQVAIQPNEDDLEALKRKYNSENEAEFKALQDKELNSLATWLNEEKKDNLKGDINQSPTSNAVSDKPNPPVVDRTLKPVDKSTNNYNLRTIMVPGDLTQKFLEKADSNTKRNIETCGILAGKLVRKSPTNLLKSLVFKLILNIERHKTNSLLATV